MSNLDGSRNCRTLIRTLFDILAEPYPISRLIRPIDKSGDSQGGQRGYCKLLESLSLVRIKHITLKVLYLGRMP